ncbi:glycosyltransferase family 2 protein [Leptolyngbya ohadii]|uniref:glycosyltransferase family 2 protein n=1 Tax=Leptolyngbya ohadii TaxID=1962290 RepID=UPI0015C693D5|nr:glycosyltransferase [Leptolyngbya ohadii]
MPKVSVIIPNYNHARFLSQRILSILNQTYQDFEIIYLDDASTDNSNEVFARFADAPQVSATICNSVNSGSPFKQWHKGIQQATGEYVWIAESDDYAAPNFLETLVPLLDRSPQVGLAYGQSYQVDEQNRPFATMHWWTDDLSNDRWRKDFVNRGIDECSNFLLFKNTIPNASGVLIRRSALEQIPIGDTALSLCGDWLTWIRLLLHWDIAFSHQLLNYFRHHTTSVRKKTSEAVFLRERMHIFAFVNQQLSLSPTVSERAKETLIRDWLHLMFRTPETIDFSLGWSLYQAARACDPLVEGRVLKQISRSAMRRLAQKLQLSGA